MAAGVDPLPDLDAALRIDPTCVDAYVNRGLARLARGEAEAAIADCTEALRLDPRCAPALGNRALVRLRKGDKAGAAADAEESPVEWPGRSALKKLLAKIRGR